MAFNAIEMDAISVDPYVLDVLMADLAGHDRKPSAFLVYLAIWSAAEGGTTALSHREVAARTGLSKRAVQAAVMHLKRRALLRVQNDGPTSVARYTPLTPWRRD